MSYKNLINKNVIKAFNTLKDLAEDVTLQKTTVGEFDFNTKELDLTQESSTGAKVVFLTESKKSSSRDTIEREVLIKFPDIVDLTRYDTLTHNSKVWRIGEIIFNNGFIYTLKIYSGV